MDISIDLLEWFGEAYFWCLENFGVAGVTALGLGISLILVRAAYGILILPMRRAYRARLFLDQVEFTMKQGQPLEDTLISLAASRDMSLGIDFHLVTAWLERGLTLRDALAKVPRYLPPQVNAILAAGARIGDLKKVLPACRQLLRDAVPQTRSALNYLLVLTFVMGPFSICIVSVLKVAVLPRFRELAEGTLFKDGGNLDAIPLFGFISSYSGVLVGIQATLLVLLWLAVIAYGGGPRLAAVFPFVQRFQLAIPWRRKRLQRDFSTMLAILLDSGVPETDAVILAADCTANNIFRRRAARAADQLKKGVKLNEAIHAMDDSGEIRWRLANAIHGRGGFLNALSGWHESLDAKAFQEEQAAAHGITTGLVAWSGLFVGAIVISVFSVLVAFTNAGILW